MQIVNILADLNISYTFSHSTHLVICLLDLVLLFYFAWQGFKHKQNRVTFLAFTQIVLYGAFLYLSPRFQGVDLLSDELSKIMYFVINIVGGSIVLYALTYINSEPFEKAKKFSFIAILIFFLGVMNLIVTANNIELFFFLFELTTLCSYLLIRYREDDVAIENALRALWMNQVGGVAILLALITSVVYYNTIYFDQLLEVLDPHFLLPVVFLVIAAYVKGASFPFHNWLLGAMVAPTPVSAILHSATMVKIAPFIVLKLSPSFSPLLSTTIAMFGAFVFVGASLMALNRDFFKEILGLSTIALLSLMISLAALGSEQAREAALILLVFHAISKALLFLQAGILEKIYHLKNISEIDTLTNRAPRTLFFILIGFASLTLPPFGAFVSKFLAIEALTKSMLKTPVEVFVLLSLIIGSVLLVILYFKIITKLLSTRAFTQASKEKLPLLYKISSNILFTALVLGVFLLNFLSTLEVLIPLVLIFLIPVLLKRMDFKDAPRVKEYNCGEKGVFEVGMFNYTLNKKYLKSMIYLSVVFMAWHLVVGVL